MMRQAVLLCGRHASSLLGAEASASVLASTSSSLSSGLQPSGQSTSNSHPPFLAQNCSRQVRWMCSPGLPHIPSAASSSAAHATPTSTASAQSRGTAPVTHGPTQQCASYHVLAPPTAPFTPQRQPLTAHQHDAQHKHPLAPGGAHPQHQSEASMFTASITPDVSAWADSTTTTAAAPEGRGALEELKQTLLHPPLRGFASSITWSASTVAAVTALGCAELLLLPGIPGGMSAGTMVAESLFSAAGQSTTLAGMLAASDGLEAVQAFSFARKLGQFALLSLMVRVATGGMPSRLFGFKVAQPLDRRHGWYWWGCWGLAGLGAISVAHQGVAAVLSSVLDTSALAASTGPLDWFTAGDPRTLPYSCRWWAETVVLAPLLEETLFRGFLLASLTRYMSVGGALLTSSGVFALCHLGSCAVTDLPLLVGMGCVLGAVYLRSRNLLAPIAAHAMHNAFAMMSA